MVPILALAFVIVGVAMIQEARSGTFPGANGRIAFIYRHQSVPRIASVLPNGKDFRILVGNPIGFSDAFDARPQWSPDGRSLLVVQHPYQKPSRLLLVKGDGTGITNLGVFNGGTPSWHPDGTAIAYSQDGDVYVANLSALDAPTLLIEDASEPRWSPDGTTIAFVRPTVDFVRHIWVADGTGGGQTQVTFAQKGFSGQSNPTWSPDSSTIAYQSGEFGSSSVHVGIVGANGAPAEQELTSVGKNAEPVWSPNGAKIGFWSSRGIGFWTMDADGSDQVRSFTWEGTAFDWQPLSVALRTSSSSLTFGSTVTLTGHVVPAPPSGEIRFYRIPAGSNVKTLIGGGTVDANGNRAITLMPAGSATYVAEWLGDGGHTLGHYWSEIRSVVVRARTTGALRAATPRGREFASTGSPRRVRSEHRVVRSRSSVSLRITRGSGSSSRFRR